MGMQVGEGSGSLTNEPNVVPMIDILLVLLIIFMMAVPMMRKAVDVQLPDPNPQQAPPGTQSTQIVLQVLPDGAYKINSEAVTGDRLGARLREIYDPRPDKIIFVKADPTVKYQAVIQAMDVARGAGVKVIGLAPGAD